MTLLKLLRVDARTEEFERCQLLVGDRVLYDDDCAENEDDRQWRVGRVTTVDSTSGKVTVLLDAIHRDDEDGGWLQQCEAQLERAQVMKAPPDTSLRIYHRVRVAHDSEDVGGQVWQYGVVRHVHAGQLLDINYDGGETSRCIPSMDVEATRWRDEHVQ